METSSPSDSQELALSEKFRKGDVLSPQCPSRDILSHMTSRWGVLVLIALLEGRERFGQLRRKIGGVSEKMLAETLQRLEKDGIVLRIDFQLVPPHVEYELTEMGRHAAQKVRDLADWVEQHTPTILRLQTEHQSSKENEEPKRSESSVGESVKLVPASPLLF